MWYGCAHVGGLYPDRSATQDFFTYGAGLVKGLGFKTLKTYMTAGYVGDYPNQNWGGTPTSLVQLAQTTPYAAVFADAWWDRHVITTNAVQQSNLAWTLKPGMQAADYATEYTEIYNLVTYLLSTYSNKEFIIKNWEGDWQLAGGAGNINTVINEGTLRQYRAYHANRMRAVHQARIDTTSSSEVYYAIEANRVLDDFNYRLHRDLLGNRKRRPQPGILPDRVSLSIYEIINSGLGVSEAAGELGITTLFPIVVERIQRAVGTNVPIFVGEYGWPIDESQFTTPGLNVALLAQKVIDVGNSLGVIGSVYWQILDNEQDSPGVPRGFGMYDRNGSSTTVGPINATGTFFQGIL